jgi:hypothetical protein
MPDYLHYSSKHGHAVIFFSHRCKIPLVSIGPEVVPSSERQEHNWLPLVVAAAAVLSIAAVVILSLEHKSAHGKGAAMVTPISAPLDPYAGSLPLTSLALSESGNLTGGKVTYLDGHIANQGNRTVTAITVQVLFRDFVHEVTQNETQPLKFIRMRDPYVDVEPVSAAPLKPGGEQDFRLIFDTVSPDWDGAYPEVRILHVETK